MYRDAAELLCTAYVALYSVCALLCKVIMLFIIIIVNAAELLCVG